METPFLKRVYSLCKRIPKGRVSTYKEIGRAIGKRGQIYRAVGVALNRNPHAPIVPCHRVVNSDGRIGGFARGIKRKIKLLKKEGVKVSKGKIVDFEKVFFKLA